MPLELHVETHRVLDSFSPTVSISVRPFSRPPHSHKNNNISTVSAVADSSNDFFNISGPLWRRSRTWLPSSHHRSQWKVDRDGSELQRRSRRFWVTTRLRRATSTSSTSTSHVNATWTDLRYIKGVDSDRLASLLLWTLVELSWTLVNSHEPSWTLVDSWWRIWKIGVVQDGTCEELG